MFLLLVFVALRQILQSSGRHRQMATILFATGTLFLWTVCSLSQPFYAEYALSQAKDIMTTLVGCLLIRTLTAGEQQQLRFLKFCLAVVTTGGLLKISLLSYALLTGISVQTYIDQISAVFGVKLMSIDLENAGGRLLFPSDNLIPIALFTLLTLRSRFRVGWFVALGVFLTLLASSLYTFSRFIWISTLFGCLLGLLLGRRDKLNLMYLSAAGAAIIIFFPLIATVVTLRFSSVLSGASDAERIWQITALQDLFSSAPIFGHGLGSYSLVLKRSEDLPYAYEVQVLAMFGQFGLVGVSLLLAALVNFYRKAFVFRRKTLVAQIFVFLLLLNLLASGFFNPSLLVSMSSVAYCMLFFLARLNSASDATDGSGRNPHGMQMLLCN
ncbi:MAG: O-antigen ligase family protein [Janthinobacterium lividum]